MTQVKTFTSPLKIFEVKKALADLDQQINQFIESNRVSAVVSVSDTCTTDDTGASIGIIRVLAYT